MVDVFLMLQEAVKLFSKCLHHFIAAYEGVWSPTPVLSPGESHGQRSLVGCSPWGHKESDMTEQLSTAQHIAAYLKMSVIVCLCQDFVLSVS